MGADPVADKSGFLCMYMSNHPDTLVSYVRYWGKITAQVSSAKMNGIDTNVRCPPPFPSPPTVLPVQVPRARLEC